METAKISKQQEDSAIRKNTTFSYDSAEREAELISDRFKNSSDVKSEMSSRMGVDFSGVRVHSDDAAHQKAQSLDAAAFTRGSDIYMGSESAIQDAGASNNQVLAHELTHTVQQGTAMQQGEGAVSQSAPTGTVQMFPNIFRRKKKAAAAATPAPFPTPAPKPAEPMPELIDKGNGQMDFSNFIEPGKKKFAKNSGEWSGEEGKTGMAGYNAFLVASGFRDGNNPFQQSSRALNTLIQQRATDEALNSSVINNLANDPVKGPKLQEQRIMQKGKIGENIGNEIYRNGVNDFSNESLDTVMLHLDDTNVQSALSAQNQMLDGEQGQEQYFQNPALRAHILLSNYLLRVQQPAQGTTAAFMEDGSVKRDVSRLMVSSYASQIASVSSAMTMLCGEPGFDPNELSDENVQQVLFNIRQEEKDSKLRKHEAFDEAAFDAKPDIASPEVVRKFGKVLAKTISTLGLGGAGAAAATPDAVAAADPAPAAAVTPAAAAAAAPAAIAAATTPPEAAAAPAAAAPAAAAPAAAAPAAAAPAAAAPAPAPLPEIGPPSTPPPALASLPEIGPPSTPPPALASLPEIGPPSTPPPALASLPEIGPPSTPPPALASLPEIGPPSTPPPALASLPAIGPPSTPPPALASLPEIGPPSTPPPALASLPEIGPPSTPPPALAPLPAIGPPSTPAPAPPSMPAPAPPSMPAPAPPIPAPAPPSTPAPAPPIPAPIPAPAAAAPAPPIPKAGVDSFESIESYIKTLREEKSVTTFNDDDLQLYDYYIKEKEKRDNPQPESEAPATPSAPKKKKGFFQKMRSLFSRKK